MNYKNYQAVIFDCDGTLLDSMPMWRNYATNLVKYLGYKPTLGLDKACNALDITHAAMYMKETIGMKESVRELVDLAYKLINDNYYQVLELKPKAKALLDELKKLNYKMIVATATPKALVIAAFKRLGIIDYFIDIICVDDFNTNKSVPRIYDEALNILGSNKENTLVFEDALHAIKTCHQANYRIVGVKDSVSLDDLPIIKDLVDEVIDLD